MMGWGKQMYYTGYRSPKVWAELGMIGDSLSFTTDEAVTKLALGYIKSQDIECAMDTAVWFTLLNAGENGEINAKQMLNRYTRLAALVEMNIIADGWYLPEGEKPVRSWVYAEGTPKLWKNQIGDQYNYRGTHFAAHLLNHPMRIYEYEDRNWRTWAKPNALGCKK